mmetsp:Transcript_41099/g.86352  ORF Transcript_41099/g.86352 Transcript_41099/m.86352 type:complete len:84 (-) Transcript_41099:190-441(-)
MQVLLSFANVVDDAMKVQAELNQRSESWRRRSLDLKNNSELSTLNGRLKRMEGRGWIQRLEPVPSRFRIFGVDSNVTWINVCF